MKRFITSALLGASLALTISFPAGAQQQQQSPQPSPPPTAGVKDEEFTFKLRGADGATYDLAEMRGTVLLVSFGATWCLPCAEELKALEQLKKEYEGRPVKFFWVSIEEKEKISDGKLRDYAKARKITLPVLRDPAQMTYDRFSTRVRLPLVVFIDKEGYVVPPHHVGMSVPELYKATMRERLDKLLKAEQSANSANRD